MKRIASTLAAGLTLAALAAPSEAFEGQYKSRSATMQIGASGGGYTVAVDAENARGGTCGSFSGPGSVQGGNLVAIDQSSGSACRLTIIGSNGRVAVTTGGDGCLFLHGASCPGFSGAYTQIGAPTAGSGGGSRPAASRGGWRLAEGSGSVSAHAKNGTGSAEILLSCEATARGRIITLAMTGIPRGWKAMGVDVTATIGAESFPLVFEGSADYTSITLKTHPDRLLTSELTSALQQGPSLVLSGANTRAVNPKEKTFALGNGAVLARVFEACRR